MSASDEDFNRLTALLTPGVEARPFEDDVPTGNEVLGVELAQDHFEVPLFSVTECERVEHLFGLGAHKANQA